MKDEEQFSLFAPEVENQMALFDAEEALRRKRDGMELAADNRGDLLEYARAVAEEIALANHGIVDSDQVGVRLYNENICVSLGPSAGSLFKDRSKWEFVDWKRSTRVTNHARLIGVWRLKRAAF